MVVYIGKPSEQFINGGIMKNIDHEELSLLRLKDIKELERAVCYLNVLLYGYFSFATLIIIWS